MSKSENFTELNCVCGKNFTMADTMLLKDIKGFTGRKIYYRHCPACNSLILTLIEKDVNTGKIYIDKNISGKAALKIFAREQKRKVAVFPNVECDKLYGWIYGYNVQIKNKKGEITQIRQYSADYYGKKVLAKKISI